MKQIITFFALFLAFTTSSYAVNSAALVTQDATSITADSQSNFFGKAKVTIKNAVNKVKKVAKNMDENEQLILIILAIVISPVAVWMYEGQTWTNRVTLNLILWLLTAGLGGIIHALYLILGEK